MAKHVYNVGKKNPKGQYAINHSGQVEELNEITEPSFVMDKVMYQSQNALAWNEYTIINIQGYSKYHIMLFSPQAGALIPNIGGIETADLLEQLKAFTGTFWNIQLVSGELLNVDTSLPEEQKTVGGLTEDDKQRLADVSLALDKVKNSMEFYHYDVYHTLRGETRLATHAMDLKSLLHPITEDKLVGLVNHNGTEFYFDSAIEVVNSDSTIIIEPNEDLIRSKTQELNLHKAKSVKLIYFKPIPNSAPTDEVTGSESKTRQGVLGKHLAKQFDGKGCILAPVEPWSEERKIDGMVEVTSNLFGYPFTKPYMVDDVLQNLVTNCLIIIDDGTSRVCLDALKFDKTELFKLLTSYISENSYLWLVKGRIYTGEQKVNQEKTDGNEGNSISTDFRKRD